MRGSKKFIFGFQKPFLYFLAFEVYSDFFFNFFFKKNERAFCLYFDETAIFIVFFLTWYNIYLLLLLSWTKHVY